MIAIFSEFMEAMSSSKKRVAITTTSVFVFWLFAGWSLGMMPAFGSGFARAEDVKSVQATLLENAIIEARIRYCTAPVGHATKSFFLKATNAKLQEYKMLTDSDYPLPLCEELVVVASN